MIGLLVVAALQSSGVSISAITGAMLATECAKTEETSLKLDTCGSYILGVADALQTARRTCHGGSDAWTLQTVTMVKRYIKDHPENWDWSPVALVQTPLIAAFPCNPFDKYKTR